MSELAWRVEEACLAACPSPREIVLGQRWLLRIAGGQTRRANAVSPLRAAAYDPTPVIASARRLYAAHGRPLLVRAPTMAQGLDVHLARAGLRAGGEVATLLGPLDAGDRDPGVVIAPAPSAAWMDAKAAATPGTEIAAYRGVTNAILAPKAFASIAQGERVVAIGYGIVHDRLLVIGSVATDSAVRRGGLGRRLVASLMAWARETGAELASLQVEADNAPARALYRALGVDRELYAYRYFQEP